MADFRLVFGRFCLRAEVKKVTSRAENPSAQAMARASSARTHNYYLDLSYVFSGHNDSVQQGLTVIQNQTAKSKLFFETQTLNWKWKN